LRTPVVVVLALLVAGCGSAPSTRSDDRGQVRLEQRLASGDTVRVRARRRSGAQGGTVCGTLAQASDRTGGDFCLPARSPDVAGIATIFANRGRHSAISGVLLIPTGARTVALETKAGAVRTGGVVRTMSAKPGLSMGLVSVAGTVETVLPARLVVRDSASRILLRSDWIPRGRCQAAGWVLVSCTFQVALARVA
jgi:hypothetical protein